MLSPYILFRRYDFCAWLPPRSFLRLFAMVSCITSFLSTAAVTIDAFSLSQLVDILSGGSYRSNEIPKLNGILYELIKPIIIRFV